MQTDELKIAELYGEYPAVKQTIYKKSFLKYILEQLNSNEWKGLLEIKNEIAVILEEAIYDGVFPKMLLEDCCRFVDENIPTFSRWEIYYWTHRLLAHGIRNAMRLNGMLDYNEKITQISSGKIFRVSYYRKS